MGVWLVISLFRTVYTWPLPTFSSCCWPRIQMLCKGAGLGCAHDRATQPCLQRELARPSHGGSSGTNSGIPISGRSWRAARSSLGKVGVCVESAVLGGGTTGGSRGVQASQGTAHILQLMLEALLGSLALKLPLAKPHQQRLSAGGTSRGKSLQGKLLLFAFFSFVAKA